MARKVKRKIHRRCKCGCGKITNCGKKYVRGHNRLGCKHSKESKKVMSLAKQNMSEETKRKISLAGMGNKNMLGFKHSDETKIKISLSKLQQCDLNYEYCDAWRDRSFSNDLRKNYCENINCEDKSKKLNNHHINLNKKDCRPVNIMTLCVSCHKSLHLYLLRQKNGRPTASPKDYIIINRSDHVSYIHKKSRTIIKIKWRP